MSEKTFIIAIDGPAASGKGTISRRLAKELKFHHLDTGLTYRGVAKMLLDQNLPLDDVTLAEQAARELDLGTMDGNILSAHDIGNAASKVAVIPSVRKILVDAQRAFSAKTPGSVLDGRDIGTVVCPNADVKIYVTAKAETRAERRFKEAQSKGGTQSYDEVLTDIKARDERDSGRKDSPMRQADDAHLLDTSKMDIETAFTAAKALINAALNTK
ncbi:(d)CMP kinase [Lentilitoribacter sp. EG35]|uniref:(d)CMP kinase n=1 Tax=Lentilitoribacter sp. EG35 TaxID=3234192 RepID=UPI00345F4D2A